MLSPLKITRRVTVAYLEKASKTETNPRILKRILGIIELKKGARIPSAAPRCGMSERRMRDWVHRFNKDGLKGLKDGTHPGQPRKLSEDEEMKLSKIIERGPSEKDNLSALRGKDVQKILLKEFGKSYSLPGAYVLLHRLGFSNLMPRPRNPRTNNIKQGIFKKNSTQLPKKAKEKYNK